MANQHRPRIPELHWMGFFFPTSQYCYVTLSCAAGQCDSTQEGSGK